MPTRIVEISDLVAAIEERMAESGLSKSEAARQLGVPRQSLQQWLHGVTPTINADNQQAFAQFLGVAPRRVLELAGFSLDSRASRGSHGRTLEAAG